MWLFNTCSGHAVLMSVPIISMQKSTAAFQNHVYLCVYVWRLDNSVKCKRKWKKKLNINHTDTSVSQTMLYFGQRSKGFIGIDKKGNWVRRQVYLTGRNVYVEYLAILFWTGWRRPYLNILKIHATQICLHLNDLPANWTRNADLRGLLSRVSVSRPRRLL